MYVDAELKFSEKQAVGATTTTVSGSSVDLKRAGEDIGNGQPIYLVAVLTDDGAAVPTYTAPTAAVEVEFLSDTDSGLATAPVVHASMGSFGASALEGTSLCMAVPSTVGQGTEIQQYIGVQFVNAGGATNISCFLTTTPQKYKQYPKGYTITG